jgi:hypothetical protein
VSDHPNRPDVYELNLDDGDGDDSRSAWEDALKELQGSKPVAKSSPPATATPGSMAKTPRTNSTNRDATAQLSLSADLPADELCEEILKKVTEAKKALADFVALHPYLVAPNIHRLWGDHFQETLVILERESGRAKEKQEGQ